MSLRKVIFWLHLIAGAVAGIIILVMSATGVALAFEKEIIAWAERDVRRVVPPAAAHRLSVDDLLARVLTAHPEARPTSLLIHSDPGMAPLASVSRTNGFYVNPYTGEARPQGAQGTRAFMLTMIEWHRYLGTRDGSRPTGKAITGAANVAFCFLALSGLYLWWPRQWTRASLRAISLFNWNLSGKARDWNWHNVVGLWSALILLVVTLTAMPISYKWAGTAIYKLTRTEAPGTVPAVVAAAAPAGSSPLPYDTLVASVQKEFPQWKQITLRLGSPGDPGAPKAVSFTVKQSAGAPRFAIAQLSLHPFTGEVLRAERYADYNLGRRVRSWTRFLHTGEALGPAGQFVAGVASLGGVVLVYTGLALAVRRFLRRNKPEADAAASR